MSRQALLILSILLSVAVVGEGDVPGGRAHRGRAGPGGPQAPLEP